MHLALLHELLDKDTSVRNRRQRDLPGGANEVLCVATHQARRHEHILMAAYTGKAAVHEE